MTRNEFNLAYKQIVRHVGQVQISMGDPIDWANLLIAAAIQNLSIVPVDDSDWEPKGSLYVTFAVPDPQFRMVGYYYVYPAYDSH